MNFDFYDSPELLDIQRKAFYTFLKQGIPELLSKQFPIKAKSGNYSIELLLNDKHVKLITPDSSPRDCILKMKTYSCKLYAQVKLVCKKDLQIFDLQPSYNTSSIVYQSNPEWVLLGQLPMMTKRGHFIINGSPRVIVHQVVRSPGIYFQKLINKDDRKMARFYGDIIPLKGVWVRLQMTKKGRIEAKFKKGKKVQVEFLQKCLQVIEGSCSLLPNVRENNNLSLRSLYKKTRRIHLENENPKSLMLYEDYSTLFDTRKSRANTKSEHDAFITLYDKLYRTTQDKELEDWQKKKSNLSFFKGLNPENAFKRKKCSENLFASFKLSSRYDLGLLGREKINEKFNIFRSFPVKKSDSFLKSSSPCKAKLCIPKVKKAKQSIDNGEQIGNKCKSTWHRRCNCKKISSPPLICLRQKRSGPICTPTQSTMDAVSFAFAVGKLPSAFRRTTQLTKNYGSDDNKYKKDNLNTQLTSIDLFSASVWLYQLRKGEKNTDDIDHSQNRRVRTAGELLQTQFENGVERLKNLLSTKLQEWRGSSSRSIFSSIFKSRYKIRYSDKSRLKTSRQSGFSYNDFSSRFAYVDMVLQNKKDAPCKHVDFCKLHKALGLDRKSTTFKPLAHLACPTEKSYKISVKELFSTKPITGALREFFGSNPLSQYMDQTNPLAEITHKRRISSLGLGGVSRESAGMAIRGIHPTHYGRICPIETPEGKNAGLVNSLAFYTKLDTNGFLKTPYYRVIDGQIQSGLGFSFTSAKAESLTGLYIAPSDLQKSSNNILRSKNALLESVPVRVTDNQLDVFKKENPTKVQLMGISPIQMISVATSLIPFLEHNDANRALMGSNMQRQAVPLMIAERPIVGTGLESIVIVESGHITESAVAGFADQITATKVDIAQLTFRKKRKTSRVLKSFFLRSLAFHVLTRQNVSKESCVDKRLQPSVGQNRKCEVKSYKDKSKRAELAPKVSCFANQRFASPCPSGKANRCNDFVPLGCKSSCKSSCKSKICSCSCIPSKCKSSTQVQLHLRCQEVLQEDLQSGCTAMGQIYDLPQSEALQNSRYSLLEKKRGLRLENQFNKEHLAKQNKISKYIRPIQSMFSSSIKQDSFLFSLTKPLTTFSRSNQNTCITEKPLIRQFDWVQKGDILSDCSASNKGELSVGKNVLVAYIPWEGYNFEDAIVISERLVREHVYTSLHIERYTFQAQDLNDGHEWFTKTLPGIEDRLVEHLEESGLPKIGSFVKEGDILVGKVRYLNKKPSSPYERLLCDILGEKNFAARNKSLYVPKGVEARVIYHKVINQFDNEPLTSALSLKELKEKTRRFAESKGNNLRSTQSPWVKHQGTALVDQGSALMQRQSENLFTNQKERSLTLYPRITSANLLGTASAITRRFAFQGLDFQAYALRARVRGGQYKKGMPQDQRQTHVKLQNEVLQEDLQLQGVIDSHDLRSLPSRSYVGLAKRSYALASSSVKPLQEVLQKDDGPARASGDYKASLCIRSITRGDGSWRSHDASASCKGKTPFCKEICKKVTPTPVHGKRPLSKICGCTKAKHTNQKERSLTLYPGIANQRFASAQRLIDRVSPDAFQGFDHFEGSRQRNPAKTVNIFLGEKRVIQVGDKISGRHGNKGVISTILPRQDMPYLPDGTPIDLILNPLGVPSRMNVGQVLECLLGLASDYLKQNFKITAFDERYGIEASKSLVFLKLYQARLQSGQNWLFQVNFPGKTRLVDGRSGECFDQWITVGKAYILKLIHMVSEKIHARSTGPYALITQQPLRGRSNKGGQRLGEMEVWALEGFGAAYTLQELLTKKSDDYFGRNQIVDSILPKPPSIVDTLSPNYRIHQNRAILGHPEIFKVLLCELQALCLDLGVYVVTPESYQRGFLGVVD